MQSYLLPFTNYQTKLDAATVSYKGHSSALQKQSMLGINTELKHRKVRPGQTTNVNLTNPLAVALSCLTSEI